MLKKTIEYEDCNGVLRKEDFYFNLSEAELTEMEYSTVGGYSEMIKKIINAQDVPTIIKIFKDLLLKTYGEKSPDGKRFIKSDELSTAFSQTEAYSKLFMELATDSDKAADFINGVMPKSIAKQNSKELIDEVNRINNQKK